MKTIGKIGGVLVLVLALYLIPGVKTIYDNLYAEALIMHPTMSAFDSIVLRALPILALGAIIYAILHKLFSRRTPNA